MSNKILTTPCCGRSLKTGKRVGSRHRWNGGSVCEWCGRFKDNVFVAVKTGSIRECLDKVYEAGGKAWDDVPDPDAAIREMRGD